MPHEPLGMSSCVRMLPSFAEVAAVGAWRYIHGGMNWIEGVFIVAAYGVLQCCSVHSRDV